MSYCYTSLLIPSSYQTAAWLFNQSMAVCCRSSSTVNRLPAICRFYHTQRLIWYNETPARVVLSERKLSLLSERKLSLLSEQPTFMRTTMYATLNLILYYICQTHNLS